MLTSSSLTIIILEMPYFKVFITETKQGGGMGDSALHFSDLACHCPHITLNLDPLASSYCLFYVKVCRLKLSNANHVMLIKAHSLAL